MTKSEGIRIVTEWEAARILESRGYTKVPCPECNGDGRVENKLVNELATLLHEKAHFWGRACEACEGQGWRWRAPAEAATPFCEMPRS